MGRAAMNNDGHGPRAHGVPLLSDPPDSVPAMLDRGGPTQDFLGPDRGQCLEVGLSSDEREILINIPDVGEQWLTILASAGSAPGEAAPPQSR